MSRLKDIHTAVSADAISSADTGTPSIEEHVSLLKGREQLSDTFEIVVPAGCPIPYSRIQSNDVMVQGLVFTVFFFIIFAFIRLRSNELLGNLMQALVQRKKTALLLNEGIHSNLFFYVLGLVLSFSSISICISFLTTQTFFSLYSLCIFMGMLLYHFLLLLVIRFLGWTFNGKAIACEATASLWILHIGIGLLLSPFVTALFFVGEHAVQPLLHTIVALAAILMIIKLFHWLEIFLYYKVSILYMILYLCSLELIPLLVLYKVVV